MVLEDETTRTVGRPCLAFVGVSCNMDVDRDEEKKSCI